MFNVLPALVAARSSSSIYSPSKMNIQMFYTSSNNNGRLPEEPNGSMNWPPIMKIKMLQLTMHVLGLQNKNKWREATRWEWNVCVAAAAAMPVSTQRGQVKGGVLQEWRVGSVNLKEDRVLQKTLGMIDVQKKAFATLIKVYRFTIF